MPPQPDPALAPKIEALKQERPKNTRAEIAARLNVCVRTVANYSNDEWLAKRGLSRFPEVIQELQVPRSAVENEAWGLCQSGDHEWMKVSLYEGHAYLVTEKRKEQPGNTGSTLGTICEVKTCSFCGFSREQKTFNWIAV